MMASPPAGNRAANWRLLPLISAPMPLQLALDEILFRTTDRAEPLLRFYLSSEAWASVGYSFREPVNDGPVPVCRRITGGGRVDHGQDLIFSLIAGRAEDESFSSVRLSYWKIHEAVKAAFESFGCKVRFYRCDENLPRGGDCFRYPIATDLAVNGTKIAGGAQNRSAGVLLHQESLRLIPGVEAARLAEAVSAGFAEAFKIRVVKTDLDPALLVAAEKLAAEKYPVLQSPAGVA